MEREALNKKLGLFMLVAGASGVGKTTLMDRMLTEFSGYLRRSVSTVTRKMRPGEIEGKHYYFWSEERFKKLEMSGGFIETAKRSEGWYGTQVSEVIGKLKEGDLLKDIDWQGHQKIRPIAKQNGWPIVRVFVMTKNLGELEKRLRGRSSNSEVEIQKRLKEAQEDMAHAQEFNHVIYSGSPEEDFRQVAHIYMTHQAMREELSAAI